MTEEEGGRRSFVLDAFVEGEPVRREVRVALREDAASVDDRRLPFDRIFWVSRRAGLLLLFSRDFTAALQGSGEELEELARAIERHPGHGRERRRVLRPLASEVVVCTAGTAARGRLPEPAGEVQGLFLAVFTQRGLHLLARERHHTLEWPVDGMETEPLGRDGEVELLVLRKGGRELRLRYLFGEEIRAARRVAGLKAGMEAEPGPEAEGDAAAGADAAAEGGAGTEAEPGAEGGADADADGDADAGADGPLEMFARREVAPPLPARLPEFSVSADAIQEASASAAEGMFADLRGPATLSQDFFEVHFQELGEVALGPLMLRKSAARSAPGLGRAVDVLDARELWEDTGAAVASAADRLVEVYSREVDRLCPDGGGLGRRAERFRLGEDERGQIERRLREPLEKLAAIHERLEAAQEELRIRLRALESGPPEGEEREEAVREAADEWRDLLRRVDRAYGAAWTELLREIARVWSEVFLPRLQRLEAGPRRHWPAWGGTAAAAAAAVILLVILILLL